MNKAQQEIKKLNRMILSRVESELEVLKESTPDVSKEVDNIYKRLRKGILDDIGDCERELDDAT